MTLTLKIVFFIASISILAFVIFKIRKSQLQIEDAIAWILGSILLILFSLFSDAIMYISNLLGFYSASNFILSMFIFFLLIISFLQNIKISTLSEKVKNLNHYIALEKKHENKEDSYEKSDSNGKEV